MVQLKKRIGIFENENQSIRKYLMQVFKMEDGVKEAPNFELFIISVSLFILYQNIKNKDMLQRDKNQHLPVSITYSKQTWDSTCLHHTILIKRSVKIIIYGIHVLDINSCITRFICNL